MQIANLLIQKLIEAIKEDELVFKSFKELHEESTIQNYVLKIYKEYENSLDDIKNEFNIYKSRFNQEKKRYSTQVENKYKKYVENDYNLVGYAKNELAIFHKNLATLESAMALLPKNERPVDWESTDEKINQYIVKIKKWSLDKINSKFMEYPLYTQLDEKSKMDFLIKDIKFVILNFLSINDYRQFLQPDAQNFLIKSDFQIKHQIVGELKTKYPVDTKHSSYLMMKNENSVSISISTATKQENVRILYKREEGEEEGPIPALTYEDDKIFLYLLTFRKDNFFRDGIIVVSLNELTLKIYPNRRRLFQNRERVLNSLKKIRRFSFLILDKINEDGTIPTQHDFSFLYSLSWKETEDSKDKILTVKVSDDIIKDLFIQYQVTAIYEKDVKHLSGLHWGIAFYLQNKRISLYDSKSKVPRTITLNYKEFFTTQSFPSKNSKKQNLKLIDSVLKYFKENRMIVHDYSNVGEIFQVTFIPISEEEYNSMPKLNIEVEGANNSLLIMNPED